MKGLWLLTVHLSGSSFKDSGALARIVIDIIFLCAVIFVLTRLPSRDSLRNAFFGVSLGTDLLIVWYLMTIINLFLHEGRLKTTYGYIIFYFCIACFKFAADILILVGTHRVISVQLYNRLTRPAAWLLFGEFIILILAISALYHVGSLFANESLWLQVADPSVISVVASRQDKFDAAFVILQFLLTLFMLIGTTISLVYYQKEDLYIPPQATAAVAATSLLWIRSISELVIVIRYSLLRHPAPANTPVARDTIYGLCTITFLILFITVVEDMTKDDSRDPLEVQMEEDSRHYVITKVEQAITGGNAAPALDSIFQVMRQDSDRVLSQDTMQKLAGKPDVATLRRAHRNYLGGLQQRYGHLVPPDQAGGDSATA